MTNKNQQLFIIAFNCKSINTKLGEFKLYLYRKKPHIVCLCEIWLVLSREPTFFNCRCMWKH